MRFLTLSNRLDLEKRGTDKVRKVLSFISKKVHAFYGETLHGKQKYSPWSIFCLQDNFRLVVKCTGKT